MTSAEKGSFFRYNIPEKHSKPCHFTPSNHLFQKPLGSCFVRLFVDQVPALQSPRLLAHVEALEKWDMKCISSITRVLKFAHFFWRRKHWFSRWFSRKLFFPQTVSTWFTFCPWLVDSIYCKKNQKRNLPICHLGTIWGRSEGPIAKDAAGKEQYWSIEVGSIGSMLAAANQPVWVSLRVSAIACAPRHSCSPCGPRSRRELPHEGFTRYPGGQCRRGGIYYIRGALHDFYT